MLILNYSISVWKVRGIEYFIFQCHLHKQISVDFSQLLISRLGEDLLYKPDIKIRFIYKYMYIQFNTCCSKYFVTCMNILCDWVPKQWKVNFMLIGNCILLILPIFIPVSKPVWQWCHSLEPSGLKFFKLKMYMKSNGICLICEITF